MLISNKEIADTFEEIASLLAIDQANPFRVRAYQNAARTIRGMGTELSELVSQKSDLSRLPYIGKDLAGQIEEILRTGRSATLKTIRKDIPGTLVELLKIPGLGPSRVRKLYVELGIRDRDELESAAEQHRIAALPGFGDKTEQRLLDVLKAHRQKKGRFSIADAVKWMEPLVEYLRKAPGALDVLAAGSYRRRKATIGDLDILVVSEPGEDAADHLASYSEVHEVISSGATRAAVILDSGIQVDVRSISPHCAGAALHYFTGSKAHSIQVRRRGQRLGLKVSEYGVFRGDKRIAGKTEKSLFKALGLPYIEPELREGRGELAAGDEGRLPDLVCADDLKGDLHVVYTASGPSLKEWSQAARRRGLEYLAPAFHWPRSPKKTHRQQLQDYCERVDELNAKRKSFALLKTIEVDIPKDGTLHLSTSLSSQVDLVIVGVAGDFDLSRRKQTTRILKAMDHPACSMLARPIDRSSAGLGAMQVDMVKIADRAHDRGCLLELDSRPDRLDLADEYAHVAKERGALICVNSIAESAVDLGNIAFGIDQARRGWLEAQDLANTLPIGKLKELLGAD